MLLFECLDLRPLHSILWKGLHLEGAGRPVEYEPECDLRALLLRQLEQIPYVKDLVKRSEETRRCGLPVGTTVKCRLKLTSVR